MSDHINPEEEIQLDALSLSHNNKAYTIEDIQDILSISRPTAYDLVNKKYFRSVRVGNRIRISRKSFDKWLDEKEN